MKIDIVFLVLLLSSCSNAKKYEEIIVETLEDYQTDSITYHANSWVPFDSLEGVEVSKEIKRRTDIDYKLCVDEYRGQFFEFEGDAILFFMRCMNRKGWRLHTEKVIVISH